MMSSGPTTFTIAPNNDNEAQVCSVQQNPHLCTFELLSTVPPTSNDCDCYAFCSDGPVQQQGDGQQVAAKWIGCQSRHGGVLSIRDCPSSSLPVGGCYEGLAAENEAAAAAVAAAAAATKAPEAALSTAATTTSATTSTTTATTDGNGFSTEGGDSDILFVIVALVVAFVFISAFITRRGRRRSRRANAQKEFDTMHSAEAAGEGVPTPPTNAFFDAHVFSDNDHDLEFQNQNRPADSTTNSIIMIGDDVGDDGDDEERPRLV